jgi:hypothetical protein
MNFKKGDKVVCRYNGQLNIEDKIYNIADIAGNYIELLVRNYYGNEQPMYRLFWKWHFKKYIIPLNKNIRIL